MYSLSQSFWHDLVVRHFFLTSLHWRGVIVNWKWICIWQSLYVLPDDFSSFGLSFSVLRFFYFYLHFNEFCCCCCWFSNFDNVSFTSSNICMHFSVWFFYCFYFFYNMSCAFLSTSSSSYFRIRIRMLNWIVRRYKFGLVWFFWLLLLFFFCRTSFSVFCFTAR